MEIRHCMVVGRSIWPTVRQLGITAEHNTLYVIYHAKFRVQDPNRPSRMPVKCVEVWRSTYGVMYKRNDGSESLVRI